MLCLTRKKWRCQGGLTLPIRQGKCIDFGGCTLADKGELIQIPDGVEFVCPECGRALTTVRKESSSGGPPWKILAGLLLVLLLGGFGLFRLFSGHATKPAAAPQSGKTGALPPAGQVVLRLCGSNTIGSELAPALVVGFLKAQGATDARILPGSKPDEKIVQGTLPGGKAPSLVKIEAQGSVTAFIGLADNSCDIGMASRKIKPDEITALASLGDMTSPSNEMLLGLDGIAIIVNRSNPLSSITKADLAQMFSGQMNSWPAGGGGAIQLYARDDKSGTLDTFRNLVLGSASLSAGAKRFEDSATLSDAVASDPNGIGFIGLPFVRNAKALAVEEQGAQAMVPNMIAVATEDYPLSRRLYLYIPENPKNPYTRRFIEFAISNAGQDIVGANGFIAQNVRQEKQTVASDAPSEYKRLTNGAER